MAWGIDFKAEIFVRSVYKDNIENIIEENNETIDSIEKELLMIAMADPKDLTQQDEDVIYVIKSRIEDLLETYRDSVKQNQLLYYAMENKDKIKEC